MTDPIRALVRDLLDFGVLCDRLLKGEGLWDDEDEHGKGVLDRARVFLAPEPPAPAPAADGEREELAQWLYRLAAERSCNRRRGIHPHPSALTRAAVLLQQAAPAPVPVTERPWERPGWCDAQGRCWWLVPNQSWPCLYLMKADSALAASVATHCLPHWAIPQPQSEEVH